MKAQPSPPRRSCQHNSQPRRYCKPMQTNCIITLWVDYSQQINSNPSSQPRTVKGFLPKAWESKDSSHARGDSDNPINFSDSLYLLAGRGGGVVGRDSIIHGASVNGDNVHAKPETIGEKINIMYKRPCENCGKTHNFLTPWGRYCSDKCKQAAYRIRKRTGDPVKNPTATGSPQSNEKRPAR